MLLPIFFAVLAVDSARLVEGNAASDVKVLIFEDLQCSDCADFRVMFDRQVLPKFASRVAFEHRDFPLPKHNWARRAAVAARFFAAVKPELGVLYRQETMAGQAGITSENFNDVLSAFARKHGVDPAKAVAALSDGQLQAAVEKDYQDAIARGVGRTPTVIINGEAFVEHFTFEQIAAAMEKAGGK